MHFLRALGVILGCLLTGAARLHAAQAHWVYFNTNHTLVYSNDDLGNHLIDYSYAGYEGGGVALPTNEPVVQTLSAVNGDNTSPIQNALNSAGNLTPGTNGIRGVVLLNPGTYNIAGTLSIGSSGVILRGSGTNTVLNFTSTASTGTAINISGPNGAVQASGSSTYTITDTYVPLGATNFHLNSTSGLSVGTGIVVRRPWTTTWVNAIGMSNYWTASGHQNDAERAITAISSNQVTVDIPLPTPIEQEWCTGVVFPYTDSGRVQQCAVENLQMNSTWGLATTGNTNGFGWTAVNFGSAKNCWARNIAFNGFGGEAINTSPGGQSKWITAQDCTYANGVNNGSARPGAFQIEGQMCLYQRLTGVSGFEHLCQSLDEATGPNVFLNCNATGSDFDGGPHRFWAVSLLTDNEYGTVGNVHIVIITGGDNGWGAGYSVFYNCHTSDHTIQCPAIDHHYNWWIGGSGANNDPSTDPGTYDTDGQTVAPTSLYLEQLKERLGGAAVENIGYPLFTITASPSSQLIRAGTNTVLNLSIGDPTLMSNTVALNVSGLPAGASASWSTNAVTGSGGATLVITASNSVAPGNYPLIVSGASAGVTHTSSVVLTIGSYSLSAGPETQSILAGTGTNFTISVTTNGGFAGSVSFGVSGLPAGAAAGFTPSSLTGNGTAMLTVTTAGNTPSGNYPLTIFGTNGGGVATASVILAVSTLAAAPGTLVWTNGFSDVNWSSSLNWTNLTSGGNGPPGVSNDVVFTNLSVAAASGTVDNIVNGNTTINSLTFENTNGFHTTQIGSGQTLTIAGSGGLLVGTETDLGPAASVYTTINGANGMLIVSNSSASVIVRQASATAGSALKATLDLSGLGNFQADISRVELGALGNNARPCGILYLARTNSIIASGATPAVILGGQGGTAGGNGGNGSYLYLGQTNAIFANGISIGTVKQGGCFIGFNPALTNASPSAVFRAPDGVSPVPQWFIADSESSGGTVNTGGTVDFSNGSIDALVDNLTVARSSTGSGNGDPTGTFTFTAGTLNIGTLQIGLQGSSGANYATATVNVNGSGQLIIGTNLTLAQVAGGTGASGTSGTLNVNGGTVQATNILGGGGIATINLNSGIMDLQGNDPFPGDLSGISTLNIGTNGPAAAVLQNAAIITVSNAIVVAANGTLAGNSFVNSPGLVIAGTIAPGTGADGGAITNSGTATLGSGGNFVVTVQDAAAGPDAGWSFLQTTGRLDTEAAVTNPFTINLVSFATDNSGLVTNFNNNTNYDWTIASAAGGLTNFSANKFIVDSSLFENDLAGGYFYVRTNSSSLILTFTNNHPPSAAIVTLYRTGTVTAIPISLVAAGWTDPDGDPVVLAGLDSSSANGTNNVGTDGSFIYCTNATGTDTILYTVQDVRTNPPASYRPGDTQRTAIGEIILLPPPTLSFAYLSPSQLLLNGIGGISNSTYYLLATTNLTLPFNLWERLGTNSFDGGGHFYLTNPPGVGTQEIFYQLEVP